MGSRITILSTQFWTRFKSRLHLRGWLGSTPEGRRPQIRGFRAGGSLAVASSTPATQLLSPAKMLRLNRTQFWSLLSRLALAALGFVVVVTSAAGAEHVPRPADALLRLVPADAAVVVTVEGLRDQANAFLNSRLAVDLQQLPEVKEWFASEKFRQLQSARAHIETLVGVNITDLRDELLGDAVVMALHLPAQAPVDASLARGLLLVKARDPALLNRVIGIVNTAQQDSGELTRVAERQRTGTTYYVREFPAAAIRLAEFYVAFGDGTFAASNSESLLESVIDRKMREEAGTDVTKSLPKMDPSLGELPRFRAVQSQLPESALARLFVEPRQFERLLTASPPPSKPSDLQVMAMLVRYLASVDYAGLALTQNNRAIVIDSVETLNPSLLDAWLRHWAGDARPLDSELGHVPPTALGLASGHLDGVALLGALSQLVPASDQTKLANIETALSGLLLGQDLRSQILPRLGPSVLAYLDIPPEAEQQEVAPGKTPPRWWLAVPARDGCQPGQRPRARDLTTAGRCDR